MLKAVATAAVATGDTVKTLVETLTVPATVKRIIGIWCYACGSASVTIAEPVTGIFELESPDINLQPLQLPLDCIVLLTSGLAAFNPRIFPCNIPLAGGERISIYVTMDMAMTSAYKARAGLLYETS